MAKHITIQERRCTRCGMVHHLPPEGNLCVDCKTWKKTGKMPLVRTPATSTVQRPTTIGNKE